MYLDLQAEAQFVHQGAQAEIQQQDLLVKDRLHYFITLMWPDGEAFPSRFESGCASSARRRFIKRRNDGHARV